MEERSPQANPRQDFEREDDLLDVVLVANDQARRPVDAFCKQVEDDHPGKEHQGKLSLRVAACTPARLEDDAEDECVNNQHE